MIGRVYKRTSHGFGRRGTGEERLEALVRRGFGHKTVLESRMRSWADTYAEAARVVSDIDRRRRAYIEQMLVEAGIAPSLAAARANPLPDLSRRCTKPEQTHRRAA